MVNGSGTTIESHAVSYLDTNPNFANTNGAYVDRNRTQDQYSLRLGGGASSPCTTTSLCTATYGYDPRDRLVQNNDGHGDRTSYTLDGAGNIQSQVAIAASARRQGLPVLTADTSFYGALQAINFPSELFN